MRAGKTSNIILWILLGVVVLVVIVVFIVPRILAPRTPLSEGRQRAQFHTLDAVLELFNNEFDGYPPSDALDPAGAPYCGAMKLCEASMGRDVLGFHPESIFRRDGKDAADKDLYKPSDLAARRGPYLPPESADAVEVQEIWPGAVGPFDPRSRVLCDVYRRTLGSGIKVGMPVLYYKADTSKTAHDVENPDNPDNIYNYKDNHALLGLGVPGKPDKKHPLFTNPEIFYKMTKNMRVVNKSAPLRADSFIVISAGYDGLYGTKDDIGNFDWKPWDDMR